jgi:chemosensory pili system protein ChpA (sensor histidine kinase/response regulator)
MEVATAILYIDAVLEDGELDQPVLGERVRRLAQRIQDVGAGAEAQPLEHWMEELYRRISDRQTMGSVVQELRSSLSEVEKQIDQYFRNPSQRELLIPVPAQLSSMRGVLSVLGMDQASQAVVHMRDSVDQLAQTEVDPHRAVQAGTFDRLADNLGALSFLIDMLSVQPQLAKTLFRFDADTGTLSAVMGQSERTSAFAAFEATEMEAAPTTVTPLPEIQTPATPPAPVAAPPVVDSGLEDDAEMREIFLEEAREVIASARASLGRLAQSAEDLAELTTVRRAFHTLKGSSRMVGLRAFGEAAWACEQLYNARLADNARMDAALQDFSGEALDYLADWVEAIADGVDRGHQQAAVAASADALRQGGQRLAIPAVPLPADEDRAVAADLSEPDFDLPGEVEQTAVLPHAPEPLAARIPDLPAAADLDLLALELPVAEPVETPSSGAPESETAPDFSLDLAELDAEPTGPVARELPELPALPDVVEAADEAGEFVPLLDPEPTSGDEPLQDLSTLVETPAAFDLPGSLQGEVVELTDDDFALEFDTVSSTNVVEATLDLAPAPLPPVPADLLPVEPPPAPEPATEVDEPAPTPTTLAAVEGEGVDEDMADESVKVIGPLRIAIPLFSIFLNEADEQSRRLGIEIAEWTLEPHRAVSEAAVALAHSLAGNSGTVGFTDLSVLARAFEHALVRSRVIGHASDGEPVLFTDAAEEIRRLLHQFAAGFLKPVNEALMLRLLDHEIATSNPERDTESPALDDDEIATIDLPVPMPASTAVSDADLEALDDIDVVDAIDGDLFPIFEEEADELLPQLRSRLSDWVRRPADTEAAAACMRTLHTFKGGARLAGAMRIGELAHRLETEIERLAAQDVVDATAVEHLLGRADTMASVFERLRHVPPVAAPVPPAIVEPTLAPAAPPASAEPVDSLPETPLVEPAETTPVEVTQPLAEPLPLAEPVTAASLPRIDWSRFVGTDVQDGPTAETPEPTPAAAAVATVRVRAPLLDRLVNQAGEVSITRARIESDMRTLQGSLEDLTENLDKLRRHLRDIELQAETQISTRMEAAKAAAEAFDPLEMDRFTRFQELTRMMAESVNDVATVQRGLQRALQSSEDELAMQARLTRELQGDLLRTRMVEFESLADRLYRVVRLAARETGKSVRLDIVGGSIEVDRGVLERMVGPFEHLLRNSVAHGIEPAVQRRAAGKAEGGVLTITTVQEGNEVAVEVRDDGAGLDLGRIRARAVERGLLAADATPSDAEIAQLIFVPGFSTADAVTGLAGRGVGMDVVRAEVLAMGGRIETDTRAGQGTAFKLLLPLTTAVTQVVMLRFGDRQVAVPSTLVEVVRREKTPVIESAYTSGEFAHDGQQLPFYWLGALLQADGRGAGGGRSQTVVVMRSAAQRVAVHVDEVLGNQEVVVKNVGPQLSRLPGLAGITLLPSGAVATIYNPVALAAVYGDEARRRMQAQSDAPVPDAELPPAVVLAPMVMVVDDSLTVRRVTQRLLVREGYRVVLAKDGMEALEHLAGERPAVLLSDIEMPRMDGFDLVRNVRADPRLQDLPVIMITSRIARKHRDYAAELGVQHYLGKPYSEDELLALVARHVQADIAL